MKEVFNFKVAFIFEMLGKPADFLKESLEKHIDKFGTNKGIKIVSRIVHEPKPIEGDSNELLTTFAEVEVLVDSLDTIFKIVLHMLPSNVEIIEPTDFKMKNFELNSVLSELSAKIHQYDEIARAVIIERDNLLKKIY